MKAVQTKVSQWMRGDVKTCGPRDDVGRAAQLMWDHDCGFVPVVDAADSHRRVVGVITDRDVCMAGYTKGIPLSAIPVGDVMSRGVRACRPDDSLQSAASAMRQHRVRRLPVVDALGDLVGVLSLSDLARWAAHERKSGAGVAPVEDVASTLAALCQPWCSIRSAPSKSGISVSPEARAVLRREDASVLERRGVSSADALLKRRQESDEQC